MLIYAIIPARSGSKGLPDKNIKMLSGKPLMAYTIEFAKRLGVDRIICSTDSERYSEIAQQYGAEVPFLRSDKASVDTAMEQDILEDLYIKFDKSNIHSPDLIVWLRPTFVFRSLSDVQRCITLLIESAKLSAARTVCESEARLYKIVDGILIPEFNDKGKSMIRRQEIGNRYKVFSTEVFRVVRPATEDFLGRNIAAVVTSKICGLDIDDAIDFEIVEGLINSKYDLVREYL